MPRPDDDREIADAAFLFQDAPEDPPPPSDAGGNSPGSARPPLDPGGYDLAEHAPPVEVPRRPAPMELPDETPEIERPGAGAARPKELVPAPVTHPWSRLGEWGPTLARIAVALVIWMGLVYLTFSVDRLVPSILVAGAGLGVVILLSYPIAITLERPVRMTPEHAVRDFYGALAHHVPQMRRMWLLLSSAGHHVPEFDSYAGFQAHWKEHVKELKRRGSGGGITPLSIRIDEFKADKSAGQEAVEASYTISFFLRGKEGGSPLYSTRVKTTLSRGPDRMWYLDDGRFPPR